MLIGVGLTRVTGVAGRIANAVKLGCTLGTAPPVLGSLTTNLYTLGNPFAELGALVTAI